MESFPLCNWVIWYVNNCLWAHIAMRAKHVFLTCMNRLCLSILVQIASLRDLRPGQVFFKCILSKILIFREEYVDSRSRRSYYSIIRLFGNLSES